MSSPRNRIDPAVGFSSIRIIFIVVVLPHPDSPTRPTVSPAPIEYETPSTAFTSPTGFWKMRPFMTGKCFFRSRISSNVSLIVPPTTSSGYSGSRPPEIQGDFTAAAVLSVRATRIKRTTSRRVGEVRGLPFNTPEPLRPVGQFRHRLQQRLGIGMRRLVKNRPHWGPFDQLAGIHHPDVVTHLGNNPDVMGNEDHRQTAALLNVLEQIEILRLNSHIQAGGRLIGNEQLWLTGNTNSTHNALTHASTHLVRILTETYLGRGNTYAPE